MSVKTDLNLLAFMEYYARSVKREASAFFTHAVSQWLYVTTVSGIDRSIRPIADK